MSTDAYRQTSGPAYPEGDKDPLPFDHMRDPTTCMRNPALCDLEITTESVDAAMDICDQGTSGGRDNCGYFRCFLGTTRVSIIRTSGVPTHTLNISGVLARSWASFTGTTSKNVNCLH